jgi:hypothetical protein
VLTFQHVGEGQPDKNQQPTKENMMKTIIGNVVMGAALVLALTTTTVSAQPVPPVTTNSYPVGTNTFDYGAYYSNNLASVADWLHDTVTNVDGTPATSMQDYADLTASTFSSSGAFAALQLSAKDEAWSWATFNGLPTVIKDENGKSSVLISEENGVPNYLASCDVPSDITINVTNVWPSGSTGFNLTGTNTTISQWDEGAPLLTHVEIAGRATQLDGYTNLVDHSMAVAGMLAAGGVLQVYSNGVSLGNALKGSAYSANIQAWSWLDGGVDTAQMAASVGTNHMRLSNHSYEVTDGWYYYGSGIWIWYGYWQLGAQDPRLGNYTTNAANYDVVSVGAPTYLQVWAAGNEQSYAPSVQPTNHYEITLGASATLYLTNAVRQADGDQGGYHTLSMNASAKDNLVVGAVNPLANGFTSPTNVTIASFSSMGPTDDGRIKPDVVADGVNNLVALTESTTAIGQGSGTSFATPSVTGAIDLLTAFYKQTHTNSSDLLSSTVKGLVIQTADSCTTNHGPSYKFGYGVVNTKTAATLIKQDSTNSAKNQIKEVLLNNGQYVSFPVVSKGGTNNPLKVTICWIDPVGSPNAVTNLYNPAIKLVNDLDLRVYSPSGTVTNYPWILNPDLTNRTSVARSAAATTGDDNRNNVEQVYIANPVTNGI